MSDVLLCLIVSRASSHSHRILADKQERSDRAPLEGQWPTQIASFLRFHVIEGILFCDLHHLPHPC